MYRKLKLLGQGPTVKREGRGTDRGTVEKVV